MFYKMQKYVKFVFQEFLFTSEYFHISATYFPLSVSILQISFYGQINYTEIPRMHLVQPNTLAVYSIFTPYLVLSRATHTRCSLTINIHTKFSTSTILYSYTRILKNQNTFKHFVQCYKLLHLKSIGIVTLSKALIKQNIQTKLTDKIKFKDK